MSAKFLPNRQGFPVALQGFPGIFCSVYSFLFEEKTATIVFKICIQVGQGSYLSSSVVDTN